MSCRKIRAIASPRFLRQDIFNFRKKTWKFLLDDRPHNLVINAKVVMEHLDITQRPLDVGGNVFVSGVFHAPMQGIKGSQVYLPAQYLLKVVSQGNKLQPQRFRELNKDVNVAFRCLRVFRK
jgi:hypothetical protein